MSPQHQLDFKKIFFPLNILFTINFKKFYSLLSINHFIILREKEKRNRVRRIKEKKRVLIKFCYFFLKSYFSQSQIIYFLKRKKFTEVRISKSNNSTW